MKCKICKKKYKPYSYEKGNYFEGVCKTCHLRLMKLVNKVKECRIFDVVAYNELLSTEINQKVKAIRIIDMMLDREEMIRKEAVKELSKLVSSEVIK